MNETLILMKPNDDLCDEIRSYRQEFLDCGSSMDGTGSLRQQNNPIEWIKQSYEYENPENVPAHWVSAEQFVLVRECDHRIVGMIQLRHVLNDYLLNYGGHIGYSVRPSERRKGYATYMLGELIQICKDKGMDKLLVTCLNDNKASCKTILHHGGIYEDTRYEEKENEYLERYWIKLK